MPVHRDLSPAAIRHEVERKPAPAGAPTGSTSTSPIGRTRPRRSPRRSDALKDLQAEGKILAFAASNTTPDDLDAYRAAGGIAAVQEEYSMLYRRIETTHLPVCREAGIAVMGYSVLALGLLSGRHHGRPRFRRRRPATRRPALFDRKPRPCRPADADDPAHCRPTRCQPGAGRHRLDAGPAGPDLCPVRRAQPRSGARECRCRALCGLTAAEH